MVFSAKTNGADEWKAIISAISTLVEEATFEATVEGISFRGMDPSHVALIDINWPNSAFEEGVGINTLISAEAGPPNGGAVFHDTAIWIKPI